MKYISIGTTGPPQDILVPLSLVPHKGILHVLRYFTMSQDIISILAYARILINRLANDVLWSQRDRDTQYAMAYIVEIAW